MTVQMYPMELCQIQTSDYSCTIYVVPPGQSAPNQTREAIAAVTMPLVVAKQLAMMLRHHLLLREAKLGEIVVPPETYQNMGVSPEDWQNWLGGSKEPGSG